MVEAGDVVERRCLFVDQGSNQVGYGHGLGRVGALQVERVDVLGVLVGQVIGAIEVLVGDFHAVDGRVFPVPEAGEVDFLAHVGFAEHGLADHAVGGQRDDGGRHAEAGGVVTIERILKLGCRLAYFLGQFLGIGEGEQHAVAVIA